MSQFYRALPPLQLLQQFLIYYPETGQFRWTDAIGKRFAGKLTGVNPILSGYAQIRFAGAAHMAHRVAWYMHHKQDPLEMQIDHINGNRIDNRICNLRLATNAENSRNGALRASNSSGHKGVSWMKDYGKWEAYIWRDYKKHTLGYFDTAEEAAAAVRAARASFHLDFARHK